jgi:hypothetical protein
VTSSQVQTTALKARIDRLIDELLASLPKPETLTSDERRGIIARYTAVLEGNFIYWMTAAHLSVASDEARAIIRENLHEEVSDNHPGMLRKFAIAAEAVPTDWDSLAVSRDLENVRSFVGRLCGVRTVLMMAFFEGFITRFMPYLAELADRRGSSEREYTDVHGVVDVVHTEDLFRALAAEMRLADDASPSAMSLFEGVERLQSLLRTIVHPALVEPRSPYPEVCRFAGERR